MAMGFDAVDAGARAIQVHKEVKQAKPLTDRGKTQFIFESTRASIKFRSVDTDWPYAARGG